MGIVGSRLKELREKKELSQGDVGKALGISRTAYLQYENGGTAHPRKLDELAKMFNVSTDYLLGLDENYSGVEEANVPHISRFGERLLELRKEHDLTQGDIGKSLGLSLSAIGKYEQGLRTPNPDVICAVAKRFGVSTDYLLGMTDERNPSCEPSEPNLPTRNRQPLDGFNNAPTHIKAAIMTLLAPYEEGR